MVRHPSSVIRPSSVISALLLGSELAAVGPLLVAMEATSGAAAPAAAVGVFFPAGFAYGRLLGGTGWAARHELLAPGVLVAVLWLGLLKLVVAPAVFLADPRWLLEVVLALGGLSVRPAPGFFAFAASVPLWWRGAHLGWEGYGVGTARLSLQLSALLLGAALVIGGPAAGPGLPVAILAAFGLGLWGLALARAEAAESAGSPLGPAARWVGWLGLVATLALAIGLASATSPEIAAGLLDTLRLVAAIAIGLLSWLVGLIPPLLAPLPDPGSAPVPPLGRPELRFPDLDLPLVIWQTLGSAVLAALLVLLGAYLWRWLQQAAPDEAAEQRPAPVPAPAIGRLSGRFEADLRWLLRWLLSRLLGRRLRQGLPRRRGARLDEREPAPALRSVRAVYREFLVWSGGHGRTRRVGETPHEFEAHWATEAPDESAAFDELTRLYVRARYAEQAFDHDAVRARALWRGLRERLTR